MVRMPKMDMPSWVPGETGRRQRAEAERLAKDAANEAWLQNNDPAGDQGQREVDEWAEKLRKNVEGPGAETEMERMQREFEEKKRAKEAKVEEMHQRLNQQREEKEAFGATIDDVKMLRERSEAAEKAKEKAAATAREIADIKEQIRIKKLEKEKAAAAEEEDGGGGPLPWTPWVQKKWQELNNVNDAGAQMSPQASVGGLQSVSTLRLGGEAHSSTSSVAPSAVAPFLVGAGAGLGGVSLGALLFSRVLRRGEKRPARARVGVQARQKAPTQLVRA